MSRLFDAEDARKQKKFMITKVMSEFGPQTNVPPGSNIPVIIPGSIILDTYKWGLIPHWAKESKIGFKMINARSETLTEKPSFRQSFANKRCLILTDGFFEWDASKTPHYIQVKDEKIFALAGLWDEWHDPKTQKQIKSCTIITCGPNSFMKPIHHRMPVILDPKDYQEWLDPNNHDTDVLSRLLKPTDANKLKEHKVDKTIGSPKNQDENLLKPVE
jgi:putative SOS response-associated peptidase YedK